MPLPVVGECNAASLAAAVGIARPARSPSSSIEVHPIRRLIIALITAISQTSPGTSGIQFAGTHSGDQLVGKYHRLIIATLKPHCCHIHSCRLDGPSRTAPSRPQAQLGPCLRGRAELVDG